jgi:hypothetical protein
MIIDRTGRLLAPLTAAAVGTPPCLDRATSGEGLPTRRVRMSAADRASRTVTSGSMIERTVLPN